MDDTKWIVDLTHHWPTLGWLVPVLLAAFYALKFMAVASEPVAKLLGGVGRRWRRSAERKQRLAAGEVGLLREEVRSLSDKVYALEKRDAIYWAYVMYDQEWHREMQSLALNKGWPLKRHLDFMEFRAKYWLERHEQVQSDNETEDDPF